MKYKEKLEYLADNHFQELWNTTRRKMDEISDKQNVFCMCGKLATGLHESSCRKVIEKARKQAVQELKHLIPK